MCGVFLKKKQPIYLLIFTKTAISCRIQSPYCKNVWMELEKFCCSRHTVRLVWKTKDLVVSQWATARHV